ncbi:MAG: hypothetical protein ABGX07_22230 [Pirellulaceae bacterium]
MSDPLIFIESDHGFLAKPHVEYFLLGQLPFDQCQAFQTQLTYRTGERVDGRISVIICEHEPLITIGRQGSRAHVRLSPDQLRARQLETRWVGRGGGCILHGLQEGVLATMKEIRIPVHGSAGGAIWVRNGLVAVTGCAVRNWVTRYGMYINVNPSMQNYGYVDTCRGLAGEEKGGMSCLLAERPTGVKMAHVRTLLLDNIARSMGCLDYDVYNGHPWTNSSRKNSA